MAGELKFPLLPDEATIKAMTDAEVEAAWLRFRWEDGHAQCPKCGAASALYIVRQHTAGRIQGWRCKVPGHGDFTTTSGTPFGHRKTPLRTILLAISIVQHTRGDFAIRDMRGRLGVGFKTAYTLFGKAAEFLEKGPDQKSNFVGYMSTKGPRYNSADSPRRRLTSRTEQINAPPVQRQAAHILAHPKFVNGLWLYTGAWWTAQDKSDLEVLAKAGASPDQAATALGRSPKSIAWYAQDAIPRHTIPATWKALIRPIRLTVPATPRFVSYPYLPKMLALPGAQLTVSVSALVSRAFPDFMRADVCQLVLLAILEGKTTLDVLRRSPEVLRAFVRAYRHGQEDWRTISLDAPRFDGDDRPMLDTLMPVSAMHGLEW